MSWTETASTRSLALIRIGLAAAIWATWGKDLVLTYNLVPKQFVVAALVMTATTMMLVGLCSRIASAVTGLGLAYVMVAHEYVQVPLWPDVQVALLSAAPVILALGPCGRSYSLDRWIALRRSDKRETAPPPELGDVRALGVLTVLVIGAQAIEALTMSRGPWLSGYTLERVILWQATGSSPPGPGLLALTAWLPAVAIAACVLWWGLVLAMVYPRTRPWAAAVGVGVQLVIYLLIPAGTGPLVFVVLYLALIEPNRVHALIDELSGAG